MTSQTGIKEELKKLDKLEQSDEVIAQKEALNDALIKGDEGLAKIEAETSTDFIKKSIYKKNVSRINLEKLIGLGI